MNVRRDSDKRLLSVTIPASCMHEIWSVFLSNVKNSSFGPRSALETVGAEAGQSEAAVAAEQIFFGLD